MCSRTSRMVRNLLKRIVDQAQISIHALEPGILFFELFDSLELVDLHATVLASPTVKRGLADSKPICRQAGSRHRSAIFCPCSAFCRTATIWDSVNLPAGRQVVTSSWCKLRVDSQFTSATFRLVLHSLTHLS